MKIQRLRVYVHRNRLFKDRVVWSVLDDGTRRLLFHSEGLVVADAKFVVSETARQRTVRTGKRTVHAGVVGYLECDPELISVFGYKRMNRWPMDRATVDVGYDPFKTRRFVVTPECVGFYNLAGQQQVGEATLVSFGNKPTVQAYGPRGIRGHLLRCRES